MTTNKLKTRAELALTETLGQMYGVDLKEMHNAHAGSNRPSGIIAHIDVFGHSHTLACAVERDGKPTRVQAALRDYSRYAALLPEGAAPLIIAPRLSHEARELCTKADAGFLDLEGNARLFVGELFIDRRIFPCRVPTCVPTLTKMNARNKNTTQRPAGRRSKNRKSALSKQQCVLGTKFGEQPL
jgi:hypothetical protein